MAYQSARADLDGGGSLADRAVGSRDDGVGVEQDAAAEVRAALGQADDVGEFGGGSSGPADDVLAVDRDVVLRLAGLEAERLGQTLGPGDRRRHGDDWQRQGEDGGQEGRHRSGLEGWAG